ncbi:short-chain dehydrogenase/reductase family oxidoreductase [Colletotrichum kahawae]|uniref:Short-chain dehydrogenase/reductase family oxidoreductase n=1 Tax=Colletotrichum kahawae TaxID=34407 RepID=A0AAE0D023_COLKA|nr:short-chain dehydrogenase/reductase family oxidoreductase [Colletotrichum kahawae]
MSNPAAAPPAMTNHTATISRLPLPPPPPLLHLQPAAAQQHNASIRHPVFFTEKLRRPPLVLSPGMGMSPVAHGYVYQDGRGADGTAGPKL